MMTDMKEIVKDNTCNETECENTQGSNDSIITAKKEKGVIYPQLIASFIVTLTIYSAGLSYGWPSVSLLHFEKVYPSVKMTEEQSSWVVTALPLGSIFGALAPPLLVDNMGRKWFLFVACIPPILSWILIYIATNWLFLLIARLVAGLLIGALYTVIPLYIGETVETRIRGASGMFMTILLHLGYITVYGIGPLVNGKMFAAFCLIPTVLTVFLFPWLPESPYYYMKKKNRKEAELSLIWLRRVTDNEEALNEINEFVEMEQGGGLKKLFSSETNRKALFILLLLLAGQQLSGLTALQSYVGILIKDMNFKFNIDMTLIVLGVISLVSGVASMYIVDRFGRKPLFLFSTYLVALCACAIATYFLLKEMKFSIEKFAAVPVAAVVVYQICNGLGLASIPAVVSSEIFPMNVKIWAASFANFYGAILSMIVTKAFQPVVDAWGYKTIFYIFAIIEIIIATTAIFVMPETARKSFIEIQDMLKESTNKETQEKKKEVP